MSSMLGRTIFIRQVDEIIQEVMRTEISKIEGLHCCAKAQVFGIQKVAKAIHDELQSRGDNQN